jgi:putative intracellular protease/amidase
MSKILMVLTSHNILGSTGRPTGFWLEEFTAPYYVFEDAGEQVTLASPKGGQPPIDPKSDEAASQTASMTRFKADKATQAVLADTAKLSDMKVSDFDAIFYSGGHGPMWDLAEDPVSIALIEAFYNAGKPVAAVCHAPGVLRHAKYKGEPLVKGKRVTGFTNEEEEEMQLTHVVPFLVEDELKRLGALFEKVGNWKVFTITDGRLITGQNPASSTASAQALVKLLKQAPVEQPSSAPTAYVFNAHSEAEDAIRSLDRSGFDVKKLSLIGKGFHSEEHPVGFYTAGDKVRTWGRAGAFWGGIWGLLLAPAVFFIPGIGLLALAGPLVSVLVGGLEGAVVVGGLSAIGAALTQIGVPKDHVIRYETAIKADKFVVVVHGSTADQDKVRSVLASSPALEPA